MAEESGKLGEGKVAYCAVEVEEMDICTASCVVVAVAVESGKLGKASSAPEEGEKGICRVSFWVVVVVVEEWTCMVYLAVEESGGVDEEVVGGGALFEMVVVDWDGDRVSCEVVVETHTGFLKFEMGD